MADIFVSYKKEDAGRVVRIVEGLRAEGFTVWWDHGIAPGNAWDQTIQRELDQAKLVVAVWSEESVSAPWVKEEAGVGKARGALVPVRIDDVEPPLGFGLIQFADLIDWDGDIEDSYWDFFIESVKAVRDGKPIAGLEKPAPKRRLPFVPILTALVLLTAIGGAAVWVLGGQGNLPGLTPDVTTDPTVPSIPRSASAAEEAMFTRVSETRLKTDYQDFLRSFPDGFYARRVREQILPLCTGEMRPVWKANPVPIGQNFVVNSQASPLGGSEYFDTPDAACAQAKTNYENDADRYCRAIANNGESRDLNVEVVHGECGCYEAPDGHACILESNYSCTYEFLTEEYVEVCG